MNPRAPRRGGMAPLGDVLEAWLKDSGLGADLRRGRVFQAWREALGEPLARRAEPVRFHDAELIVEVESAAHLQELAGFTGEEYRRLANQRLGRESIRRVVFQLKR